MFAYARNKPARHIQYINSQSKHARREDASSERRIRPGAVAGTQINWSIDDGPRPDYGASFRAFKKERGASERKGSNLCAHILVGVSPDWVRETGDLHDPKNPRNIELMEAAKAWANSWSNDGCFAARLDLDEKGGAIVDLFIAPTAMQSHKDDKKKGRDGKLTVSVNKAFEALSAKHTGLKGRHYSAINTDWAEYAKAHLDQRLERGKPKDETGAVHIPPDQYRKLMEEAENARNAADQREKEAAAAKASYEGKLKALEGKEEELDRQIEVGAQAASEGFSGAISGRFVHDGKSWSITEGPTPEWAKDKKLFAKIAPMMKKAAEWWAKVRHKVEALPEPKKLIEEIDFSKVEVPKDVFGDKPAAQRPDNSVGPEL